MRTRTRIVLAGLALGAALVGGIAWATVPADNSLYTACKLKATGTIRLIDPSGPSSSLLSRCTSLETQITWNQNGQKGDAGPAGAPPEPTARTVRTAYPAPTDWPGPRATPAPPDGRRRRRQGRTGRAGRQGRAGRAWHAGRDRPARAFRDARRWHGVPHEPGRNAVRRRQRRSGSDEGHLHDRPRLGRGQHHL